MYNRMKTMIGKVHTLALC
ncbi:hypothetical protein RDABS01_000913 [Bienertia sinuspersici]